MQTSPSPNLFNALVFGGSGAVGRQFIKHAFNDPTWGSIYIVTRRTLPEFEELQAKENGHRLKLIMTQDITDFESVKASIGDDAIDLVVNLLGSRTGKGKDLFIKIDKTIVVQTCVLAHEIGALLFSHVTSTGADPTSFFFYLKVKGECEQELIKSDMQNVSIFRPGFIANRDNDWRFVEAFCNCCCCCCMSSIECKMLGQKILVDANQRLAFLRKGEDQAEGKIRIYENKDIKNL